MSNEAANVEAGCTGGAPNRPDNGKRLSVPPFDIDLYRRAMPMSEILHRFGRSVNRSGKTQCRQHDEKTDSCHVYPYHLHCFGGGCGYHPNTIGYVQDELGVDFWGALEWIAREAGLPMPRRDPEAQKRYEAIKSVSELYLKVYQDSLKDPEPALAYLEKRGIPREVTTGVVGYLPHDYKPCDLETGRAAGLASKSDRVLHADRLIIPIYRMGQIVSLYGRALDAKRIPTHIYPATTDPPMPAALWGLDDVRREKTVYLCESIIDALTLRAQGLPAIAAFGTQGLTDARIQLLKGTGIERVVIIFDTDSNGSGQKGTLTAGYKLFKAGFDVTIMSLLLAEGEKKTDPNSYFLTHSREDFDKLPQVDLIEALARALPVDDGIKRFFQELGKLTSLIAKQPEECHESYVEQLHTILKTLGLGARKIKVPTLASLTKKVSKKAAEKTKQAAGDSKFKPLPYVDKIRQQQHVIRYSSQFWRYQNGVYRVWFSEEIDKLTASLIGPDAQRHQVSDVRALLESQAFVRDETVNSPGTLNLANGLLNMTTGEFTKHTHEFLSTVQTTVRFEANAPAPPPLWGAFLERSLLEQDKRELLAQIIGYCLTTETHHHKAFIFLGGGANGKSVVLEVIEALLGKENCSALTLGDLNERFRVAELQGKLCNLSYEAEVSGLIADAKFKSIVAGEPVLAERKHRDPFKFKPVCKWIIACNRLPDTRDKTFGYRRRVMILPFEVRIPEAEQDKGLAKKIIETELPGVLNWALAGYLRLSEQGKFTIPEASERALESYRRQIDPTLNFIEDCLDKKADATPVLLQKVYTEYQAWCKANGHTKPLSSRSLRQTIEDEMDAMCVHTKFGKQIKGVCLLEGDGL